MTFNSAISGLSAANQDLSVVGNNIANANTTGFKSTRADFADIYGAASGGSGGLTSSGSGVSAARTSQSFTQGSVSLTGNSLDVSINGSGFFVLDNGGKSEYTRAGLLALNSDGALVNSQGGNLQGYQVDVSGALSKTVGNLTVDSNTLSASQTSTITAALNLDARQATPVSSIFSAKNPDSYNYSTSTSIFDSLGNVHTLNAYFSKTSTANQWKLYAQIDGANIGNPVGASISPTLASYKLAFNSDGTLDAKNSDSVKINHWIPLDSSGKTNASTSSGFAIDINNITQLSSEFSIHKITQDGFSSGQLNAINIANDGKISAHYTNGQDKTLGKIALANFSNVQGLQSIGGTHWAATKDSGAAVLGAPTDSGLGGLQSGALEGSNVDLSNQLVSLIIAQRNFQANAKSIQTEDAISQAIINIH